MGKLLRTSHATEGWKFHGVRAATTHPSDAPQVEHSSGRWAPDCSDSAATNPCAMLTEPGPLKLLNSGLSAKVSYSVGGVCSGSPAPVT